MADRSSIQQLLPSHRRLVERYRSRIVELLKVAQGEGLDRAGLGVILADTRGEFGSVATEAGEEFVVFDDDHFVVVVALGIDGLMVILGAVIPEALPATLRRLPGTIPVVVVDADDEPALVIMELDELVASQS